jgi:hypothetical protein
MKAARLRAHLKNLLLNQLYALVESSFTIVRVGIQLIRIEVSDIRYHTKTNIK